MIETLSGVRQSSPAELQAFDATCEQLSGFNPDLSFEWIDGFLAALAAGPGVPETSVWLPLLCGDAFERAFADPHSADQARHALQVRLKVLCAQLDPAALLDDGRNLRLDPLMSEWTDADRERLVADEGVAADDAQTMQTGALWAQGFLDAVELFPDAWHVPADDEAVEMQGTLLGQIAALLIPPGHAEYREHIATYYPKGEPTRDELVAEACWAAQELRVFWTDHAPKPITRRVQPTPGRNDACHCGSGKKFKKCHGAADAQA